MIEYPAPCCGSDGPHFVVDTGDESWLIECGACAAEFEVPVEVVS